MSETPNLMIGLLAAGQAQKHVTVNEALLRLDAVVHLSLRDRTRTAPPEDPQEGDRHLVAADATGGWAGRDGEIAVWQAGGWVYLDAREGWLAWVEDEAAHIVRRDGAWEAIRPPVERVETLGVATDADEVNVFAAKLNSALWAAKEIAEGGTGDLRYVMNKEAAGGVLSLLMQSGYSGRAEIGLVGNDDCAVRVSPDGQVWHDALRIDRESGSVATGAGLSIAALNDGPLGGFRNLIINGSFAINQRRFTGGTLADEEYGFDRWRAIGSDVSVALGSGTVSLTGTVEQIIEAPDLGGQKVTISVENPDADLEVSVAGVPGTIAAGAGRRGVSFMLPAGATEDVAVRLTAATSTQFSRVQLETGDRATPFERRPLGIEMLLCQRYYFEMGGNHPYEELMQPICVNSTTANAIYVFPTAMRRVPTFTRVGNWVLSLNNNIAVTAMSHVDVVAQKDRAMLIFNVASGLTMGQVRRLFAQNDLSAKLRFSAEF